MAVAGIPHHAELVHLVLPGRRQVGVSQGRRRQVVVGHLLPEGVQRSGGDADELVDTCGLKRRLVLLDVVDLIPAGLTTNSSCQ